jgi:hypothetical protein
MSTTPPPLAPDLTAPLRRLKLAAMRRLAPELLLTAKTQRWAPEELLRTLVEAEITARDESNARNRMRVAAFPVAKTLTEFDLTSSAIPRATFDYLASLEWIRAAENACLIGPAGTRQEPHPFRARGRRGRSRPPGPLLHRRRPGRNPLPGTGRQLRRPHHRHPAPQRPDHLRRATHHDRGTEKPADRQAQHAGTPSRHNQTQKRSSQQLGRGSGLHSVRRMRLAGACR